MSGRYFLWAVFALLMLAFALGVLTMTFYGAAISMIALVINFLVYRMIVRGAKRGE